MTVLDAVRAEALAFLSGLAQRPDTPDRKGSMPYLVATCPTIRRHWLALMERYAHVVAAALVAQSGGKLPLASAKVLGGALMSVFAVIVDELGQTMADDAPVLPRLKALRRQIERAIDQMANGFA
jgi:hypothetical protein